MCFGTIQLQCVYMQSDNATQWNPKKIRSDMSVCTIGLEYVTVGIPKLENAIGIPEHIRTTSGQ